MTSKWGRLPRSRCQRRSRCDSKVTRPVRVLVGEGSPVQLGTPALILNVELPTGGELVTPVPREFQGFAYLLGRQSSLRGEPALVVRR